MSQPHTVSATPQSAATEHGATPRTSREWYGYQTLLADAASVGLIAAGFGSNAASLAVVGLGTAVLAPPFIHLVHGSVWVYLSAALRIVAASLVVRGVLDMMNDEGGNAGCETCASVGLAIYGGSVLLDATLLSIRVRPAPDARERAAIGPMLAPGVLGVAGRLAL